MRSCLPIAAVGLIVARRQPGNPIGWLLLAGAGCLLGLDAGAMRWLVYRLGHQACRSARSAVLLEVSCAA